MGTFIDLTGKKFGKWTAIEYLGSKNWLCECECGTRKSVDSSSLKAGTSKSCGCLRAELLGIQKIRNLKGQQFGKWLVLKECGRTKTKSVKWLCRCSCGRERVVIGDSLTSGKSTACGLCREKLIGTWAQRNPEEARKGQAIWRANNKEARRKITHRAARKRLSTPTGKLNASMGTGMWESLKKNKAGRHWETLVGYNLKELMEHLEEQFQSGMTWDNQGKWHLDHIKPKASFNFKNAEDEEFKECWCLENLQPLWEEDNLKKGSKY